MERRKNKTERCTVSVYYLVCMQGINIGDYTYLLLAQPESLHTMSYYSLPDCFVKIITHTSSRPLKWGHPSKNKQNPIFFNSFSVLWGVPLFLALQSNHPEGYFSPHHLTCPAVCSVTGKPSGLALSLVPADGTVVLMGHSGVLETVGMCSGEVLQSVSNSNTIWAVKCQGKMWGMDKPAPWQQKQKEDSQGKCSCSFPGFPLSPITRCSLGLTVRECWRV